MMRSVLVVITLVSSLRIVSMLGAACLFGVTCLRRFELRALTALVMRLV